eukprot:m.186861 g.186861  ORF g.186861 m.186861 type:complete len:369 (-) comp15415_c0_seq1:410-1516(-)
MSAAREFIVGTCNYYDPKAPATHVWIVKQEGDKLEVSHSFETIQNPQFLTFHGNTLYLVSDKESTPRTGTVAAYRWDPETRTAQLINTQDSCGRDPCHVFVAAAPGDAAPTVLLANYTGGTIAAYPVAKDGALGPASDSRHHDGVLHASLVDRQESPHPHAIYLDPYVRKWVLVPDLGLDTVFVYEFLSSHSALAGATSSPRHARLEPGSGPRHLSFHPTLPIVYALCELTATVVVLNFDVTTGSLTVAQTLATLPAGVTPKRDHHCGSAHIYVRRDGAALYLTNRTDKTIVALAIDAAGHVSLAARESTRGETPRNFCLTRDGKHIVVANQNTNNLVLFTTDASGSLTHRSELVLPEPPTFVAELLH